MPGLFLQMLWVDRGEGQNRKRLGLPFLPRERSFGDTHLAGSGLRIRGVTHEHL